jgi:hypothetical protein
MATKTKSVWGKKPAQVKPLGWTPGTGVGSPGRAGVVPGRIHIWRAKGDKTPQNPDLICLLNGPPLGEPPRLIRGLGGWEQIQRGGRRAGSHWPGGETPAFEIQVRLENRVVNTGDDGTRQKMRALEVLMGGAFSGDEAPPTLKWAANVPLHDYSTTPAFEWVCESFDYGRSNYTDQAGLLEQEATFVLAVYESAELPKLKRAKPFPRKTLEKGKNLRDFAGKYLGERKRWDEVLDLNRDNPKCPKSPDHEVRRPVLLAVPPREKGR